VRGLAAVRSVDERIGSWFDGRPVARSVLVGIGCAIGMLASTVVVGGDPLAGELDTAAAAIVGGTVGSYAVRWL
jgi:hypothetical protein